MKKIIATNDKFGLFTLNVNIGNPKNKKIAKRAIAVVDTGATSCHIKQELIEYLELPIMGNSSFLNPNDGDIKTNVYSIDLDIIDLKLFNNINVRLLHDNLYPADFILGTDILRQLHLSFQPESNDFYISVD